MAFQLLPALLGAASVGSSIYGASKQKKTEMKRKMTPQQEQQLKMISAYSTMRQMGILTPEERGQIATAKTMTDVGQRDALRLLQQPGMPQGQTVKAMENVNDSALRANVAAGQQIREAGFKNAVDAGKQIALRGPITGATQTMPNKNMGSAGQALGALMGMMMKQPGQTTTDPNQANADAAQLMADTPLGENGQTLVPDELNDKSFTGWDKYNKNPDQIVFPNRLAPMDNRGWEQDLLLRMLLNR